jgi:Ca2+/H+ antiporter
VESDRNLVYQQGVYWSDHRASRWERGELSTAVSDAIKGHLGLAIGVFAESTFQITLLVIPFTAIWGWINDQPISLHFNTFAITVFSPTAILT